MHTYNVEVSQYQIEKASFLHIHDIVDEPCLDYSEIQHIQYLENVNQL